MAFKSPWRGVPAWGKIRERGMANPVPYWQRVLNTGPIAYWPLWEASGTTAECLVNPLQNGTYSADVSTFPVGDGIGDGSTAPQFDGLNDYVDIYSATLAAAFSATAGTLHAWLRVSGAAVWTDGLYRNVVCFFTDWNNYTRIYRDVANNTLGWHYEGNNVAKTVTQAGYSFTTWAPAAVTWDTVAGEMKAYLYGAQVGLTQAGPAAWVGALGVNTVTIGSRFTTPNEEWSGPIAHVGYWDSALPQSTLEDLAVV